MSKYPSSVVAWEGTSQLDGQPIVLIITGLERPSANTKTGNMAQAIVIRQDQVPTEAVKSETDKSICGDCPLRKDVCYVNLVPMNQVHRAYVAGNYPTITQAVLERAKELKKRLRITAYGDPSAVPLQVWQNLLQWFPHHTGYTHQWRHLGADWSDFLMASCESEADVLLARSRGWSTFRVKNAFDEQLACEMECPNLSNPDIQCNTCRLCSGSSKSQRHIEVTVHGFNHKIKKFATLTNH